VGVAIDSLEDMEILFDGIRLTGVSTSMTINAPAAVLLAMYIAVAEKQGWAGTRSADHPERYPERVYRPGHLHLPAAPLDAADHEHLRVLREGGSALEHDLHLRYHIREAARPRAGRWIHARRRIEYVRAATGAGLQVDAFAGQLSFFFNAHNDLLEEVAKYRAARRLWRGS